MQKVVDTVRNLWQSRHGRKMAQSVLNSLSEGIIITDYNGKFIFFNTVAEKILGIGPRKITLAEWTSVYGCYFPDKVTPYPPEQLPLAQAIRGKEISDEHIFIKNDAKPEGICISVSASPLRNNYGAIIGGTVVFRDISEMMRIKTIVRQSEKRIKAQFQGFPIPTFVWKHIDDDFILIDYNTAAKTITNGKVQDLAGAKLSDIYDDSENIRSDFKKCFDERGTIKREMLYRLRTTGESREFNVSYVFISPDLIMVHAEDMTEKKNDKHELKKLSSAVEQTADTVIITDQNGVVEYVNRAFVDTTGYTRDEIVGQTPRLLKSGLHDKLFYESIWGKILNGKTFRGTVVNKKKSGNLYWCEQTITPMKDNNGEITNFVSVIKDITEIREKREQDLRLKIAREIQERLLKQHFEAPGLDIAGATNPAVETTGDYYDVFYLPDGSIGMVVADVSGHGIGAALIMTQTRAYVRAFARTESDPGVILNLLNQELVSDLDDHHFVTLILARLDPRKNILDYASAGHVPAYVLNKSGEVSSVLMSNGIPLGTMFDWKFQKSELIQLAKEDLLVFFSDGILEMFPQGDPDEDLKRALNVVSRHRDASSRQILDYLYEDIRIHLDHRPQEDDMTSLICKISDKTPGG
jgi:PAS domain S-box-containing protein